MLKTNIYSIRCFAGDVVELIQLRTGNSKPIEDPIVLNQKMLYLDEDLARTISIYSNDVENNYKLLEEALKYSDNVMETFCPQEKSITFFKCSKNNKSYYYNGKEDMLEYYKMLHGTKIGFIVRNGENLYVGWLEEKWDNDDMDGYSHVLTFTDDVIYKPGENIYAQDETPNIKSTSLSGFVSRLFALNVLQGLIEHKNILQVPEQVNISKPSKYVVHNYADAWIDDNKYGNFSTTVKNLNYFNHSGDTILLITKLREANQKNNSAERSIGYLNTTRDCKVSSGLNKISIIKDDRVFISAEKEDWGWIERKNKANFEVDTTEFVNLTFMNSDWLKYYIDTKKIGQFGHARNADGYGSSSLDYSYLIYYFKIAYDYLVDREADEYELINKYCSNINDDWRNLLSHWKIKNKVRNLTEFSAKRFAKYLESGHYIYMKHLFTDVYKRDFDTYNCFYYVTDLPIISDNFSKYLSPSNSEHYNKYEYFRGEFKDADMEFNNDSTLEDITIRVKLDVDKCKIMYENIKTILENHNLSFDDNFIQHLKKYNPTYDDYYSNNKFVTTRTIFPVTFKNIKESLNNIDNSYLSNKSAFIKELEIASKNYSYYSNISEKLYELIYLAIVQIILVHDCDVVVKDYIEEAWRYETI